MQRINIDLNKNPEVAELIADMEVGDEIVIRGTIHHKDDQTLKVELDEVDAGEPSEEEYDESLDDSMEFSDDDDEE